MLPALIWHILGLVCVTSFLIPGILMGFTLSIDKGRSIEVIMVLLGFLASLGMWSIRSSPAIVTNYIQSDFMSSQFLCSISMVFSIHFIFAVHQYNASE